MPAPSSTPTPQPRTTPLNAPLPSSQNRHHTSETSEGHPEEDARPFRHPASKKINYMAEIVSHIANRPDDVCFLLGAEGGKSLIAARKAEEAETGAPFALPSRKPSTSSWEWTHIVVKSSSGGGFNDGPSSMKKVTRRPRRFQSSLAPSYRAQPSQFLSHPCSISPLPTHQTLSTLRHQRKSHHPHEKPRRARHGRLHPLLPHNPPSSTPSSPPRL